MLTLAQLYKTAVRVIWCRVRVPTALYDKGEANDYIMLFISPSIALLILLLAINPVFVLLWLAIKLK